MIELIVLIAREADGTSVRSDVIEALDTYLLDHTDHRVTLAEMAHVSGLNPSYLSRRFKEVCGEPPTARHMRIRLERAAELLREGSRVADAAERCGFRSVHHFSTAFHRHFGTAPSDFHAGYRVRSAR